MTYCENYTVLCKFIPVKENYNLLSLFSVVIILLLEITSILIDFSSVGL